MLELVIYRLNLCLLRVYTALENILTSAHDVIILLESPFCYKDTDFSMR